MSSEKSDEMKFSLEVPGKFSVTGTIEVGRDKMVLHLDVRGNLAEQLGIKEGEVMELMNAFVEGLLEAIQKASTMTRERIIKEVEKRGSWWVCPNPSCRVKVPNSESRCPSCNTERLGSTVIHAKCHLPSCTVEAEWFSVEGVGWCELHVPKVDGRDGKRVPDPTFRKVGE